MPDGPIVAIIVLAVGGLLAAAYFVYEHRRHRSVDQRAHARVAERIPLFGTDLLATRGTDGVVHVDDGAEPADGAPRRRTVPRRVSAAELPTAGAPAAPGADASSFRPRTPADAAPAWGAEPSWAPPPARSNGRSAPLEPAHAAAFGRPTPATGSAPVSAPPLGQTPAGPAVADAAFANGETLRFALPDEGTLRFLPGRLEVVAGPDAGREIRFVAPPGTGDAIEITFGRTEGPAYRHIQLLARTVSRRHAVMALTEGHWSLQNLSATNPVLLNGRALAPDEIAPLLVDGDRIEMGEVVFTFHSR